MRQLILVLVLVISMVGVAAAIERLPAGQVDSDKLTPETQVMAPAGADNFNLIWWVPVEFWEAVMTEDPSTDPEKTEDMLESMRPYTVLAIVMADLGPFGSFEFYPRERLLNGTTAYYLDSTGSRRDVVLTATAEGDMALIVEMFRPILRASMGNMGENFHFFVVEDKTADGGRLIDPYHEGRLVVELTTTKGDALTAEIVTPLDALFKPRKCPNGRDAHVSWKYCPWTGKKLPD